MPQGLGSLRECKIKLNKDRRWKDPENKEESDEASDEASESCQINLHNDDLSKVRTIFVINPDVPPLFNGEVYKMGQRFKVESCQFLSHQYIFQAIPSQLNTAHVFNTMSHLKYSNYEGYGDRQSSSISQAEI